MDTQFSEFSFGFAYTFEIASMWKKRLITSPELPSLSEEGEKGYDVRLEREDGFIYCAQFKRSERMERSNATEAAEQGYPLPYYRFPIYGSQRSQQHELLCDLERNSTARVEYVAPRFIDSRILDRCFKRGNLRSRVIRVRPSAIG